MPPRCRRWTGVLELFPHLRWLPLLLVPYPFCWFRSLLCFRCTAGLGGLPVYFGNIDTLFGHFVERGEFTQFRDDLYHLVGDIIHFFFRIEASETEADG